MVESADERYPQIAIDLRRWQYIPERLELVTELPRMPSGKVKKFKLRETAKAFSEQLVG
jgi:acyl-coenzyme A synthetase/AMP-(fatty) acid ligase